VFLVDFIQQVDLSECGFLRLDLEKESSNKLEKLKGEGAEGRGYVRGRSFGQF
jgi:hypothetical protein